MTPPPHDRELEAAVLGAVLLSDRPLSRLAVDDMLRPHHFYVERHEAVYRAMLRLLDRGEAVDANTVTAELERTRTEHDLPRDIHPIVDGLTAHAHAAGNVRHHAARVIELADLRRKLTAAREIIAGVEAEDDEAIREAEAMLASERASAQSRTAEQIADDLYTFMQAGDVQAWPLPWQTLTRYLAGGFKPGGFSVVSGHSSHGKSVVVDQCAESAAKNGARVHIYLTEMTERERALRFIARYSGLPLLRLVQAKLRDGEEVKYLKALDRFRQLGIGFTDCDAAGWKPEDIARDIRLRGWDMAIVDLFNEMDVGEGRTRDFDRAVRILKGAAKGGTHVLVAAHVNEARSSGTAKRPKPTLGDLRSTGMLKNAADNVIFVFRDQDDEGEPEDEGVIYIRKARNALLGSLDVQFKGSRMRFDPLYEEAK